MKIKRDCGMTKIKMKVYARASSVSHESVNLVWKGVTQIRTNARPRPWINGCREKRKMCGHALWLRVNNLRKHGHLRCNIRFETSGATAKSHGSTYVSVERGKLNVWRLKQYSAISTITEAFGSVDSIRSLTTYVCGEETSKNDV